MKSDWGGGTTIRLEIKKYIYTIAWNKTMAVQLVFRLLEQIGMRDGVATMQKVVSEIGFSVR